MFCSLLFGLVAIRTVHAWGDLGHQAVRYIAQNFISDETRDWVQNILKDTSDTYLANASTFADDFKYTHDGWWSKPYHYIDAHDLVEVAPVACFVHYPSDCSDEGCIIDAIANCKFLAHSAVPDANVGCVSRSRANHRQPPSVSETHSYPKQKLALVSNCSSTSSATLHNRCIPRIT